MRDFITKIFGGSGASDLAKLPIVSVAAFGKHPAWGDHIDNLGDDSPVLAFVRDRLYREGLTRQIETGAWEKLPAERCVAEFDHFLIWYLGGRMVIGLLWSSSDSRRRTQYPLVLVAETHRHHEPGFVRQVQQALLDGKRRCVEATEQSAVAAAVAEVRGSLQRIAPRQPVEPAALRLSPEFQPAGDDVPRVLHELRGSCSHLSNSRWTPASNPTGASMLRVRLSSAQPGDLLNWIGLVSSQIHPSVPLLGLAERSEGTGDLLLGTPGDQNFFCLRASPNALPFTTDIPFEIPSGLRDYATSLVAGLRKGERPARTVFGDTAAPQNSWKTTLSLLKT